MRKRFRNIQVPFIFLPILLLIFSFFSYGILAGKLGIYWDDWAYVWTRLELGYEGLLRHFSFSRPVAGQIHNLAILMTGKNPLRIQLFGLIMRVLSSTMVGYLVYQIWGKSRYISYLCALFFIAYPGFTMQPIAINFSFSYFLIGILCLSFLLTIRAIRKHSRRFLLEGFALILSGVNLFASEYFFLLELIRPLIISVEISKSEPNRRQIFLKSVLRSAPYGILFIFAAIYRIFFNQTQTSYYDFSILREIKTHPFTALASYVVTVIKDCYKVLVSAWLEIFHFPSPEILGQRTFLMYVAICLILFVSVLICLYFLRNSIDPKGKKPAIQLILIGIVSLILAGQPFWLTNTNLSFVFQNSRFTLPFILGVSFVWGGVFSLFRKTRILFVGLAAILIGLSAGRHFVNANEYRRDWTLTKDFFWQLKWRAPAIAENTVFITNVLPIRFSTDNSLTAPLNWIYADGYVNQTMPYMLYTNTKRENSLSGMEAGQPVFQEYLSAQFFGKTSDAISIYFNAPGCVHVLDPEVDLFNQMIPIIDRDAALLNNYSRILTDVSYQPLDSVIFGPEPVHGWCWYYEQADLSRQRKDWQKVVDLGNEAFSLSDYPNDPMERIPFIEGYAHVADWEQAIAQTTAALEVTPMMNNPLCVLWNRIDRDCQNSEEKNTSVNKIQKILDCSFLP
jgi:hypothetical protein